MPKYLSNVGKVSKVLLIILASFFVLISLGGISLLVFGDRGVDPSVGVVGDSDLSQPSESVFQRLDSENPFISEETRLFMGFDYQVLFNDFHSPEADEIEPGLLYAVISKVVYVDSKTNTIGLHLEESDLEFIGEDSNVVDGSYRIVVDSNSDVLSYSLSSGVGNRLKVSDISVDTIVAYYPSSGVLYVRRL